MKRAFTLIELLVVVAIMGLLGTTAVGGYRAMQRGMEEKGVMQNVNQFIRTAYQRAQIDRQPVAVYYWNETQREESDTAPLVVVGKAVAVRRSGRVTFSDGNLIGDEFADLRFNRMLLSDGEEDESSSTAQKGRGSGVWLYHMNGGEGSQMKRSLIAKNTKRRVVQETMIFGKQPNLMAQKAGNLVTLEGNSAMKDIEVYASQALDKKGVEGKIGDASGFEFAELTLPHNYIFGSSYSPSISSPIKGEGVMRFKVSANSGSGTSGGADGTDAQVHVYNLRQIGGSMTPKSIATSDKPWENLKR